MEAFARSGTKSEPLYSMTTRLPAAFLFALIAGCAGLETSAPVDEKASSGASPAAARQVGGFTYEPETCRAKIRGRGSKVSGYYVFDRVRHRSISAQSFVGRPIADWLQYPTALPRLMREISRRTGLVCRMAGETLDLDDPRIHKLPLVYMTGTRQALFSGAEKENLKKYLVETGGFLWIDEIDLTHEYPLYRSVVSLLEEILPDSRIYPVPIDHPIFQNRYRFEELPTLRTEPTIQGREGEREKFKIRGIDHNGRMVALIDTMRYITGWEEPKLMRFSRINPAVSEQAVRVGVNVILHVLTHSKLVYAENYSPWGEGED